MNYYPYLPYNPNQFPSHLLTMPTNYVNPVPVDNNNLDQTYSEEGLRPWQEWEDNRLSIAAEKFQGKGWRKIAMSAFPDNSRSKEECLKRWRQITKSVSVKGLWTTEEDAKLTALVAELGAEKWVSIANRLNTRTGKQCRERWHNHLDPRINKAPFTKEEEYLIFELHAKLGSKWAEISKRLVGRSDNSIKNFFNTAMQRKRKLNSSSKLNLKRKERGISQDLNGTTDGMKQDDGMNLTMLFNPTDPTRLDFHYTNTNFTNFNPRFQHPHQQLGFNHLPLHLQLPMLTPPHTPQLLTTNFDMFPTPYAMPKGVGMNSMKLDSLPYLESSPALNTTDGFLDSNGKYLPSNPSSSTTSSNPSSGLLPNQTTHNLTGETNFLTSQPETPNNFNSNSFLNTNNSYEYDPFMPQFTNFNLNTKVDSNSGTGKDSNYLGLVNLNFNEESNQFTNYLNQ